MLEFIVAVFDRFVTKYGDVFTTSVNRAMEEKVAKIVRCGKSRDSVVDVWFRVWVDERVCMGR